MHKFALKKKNLWSFLEITESRQTIKFRATGLGFDTRSSHIFFVSLFTDLRREVVSYRRKYENEVLVNH